MLGADGVPLDGLGAKQSPSFRDRDNNNKAHDSQLAAEAVSAVYSLEREIAAIDERFERKEMNSFGVDEEVVLQRFQELRRRQVDLSRRQVELLSKKTKGRLAAEQRGLDDLALDMQKLCSMIEQVELLAQPVVEQQQPSHKDKSEDDGSADLDSSVKIHSSPIAGTAPTNVNNDNNKAAAPNGNLRTTYPSSLRSTVPEQPRPGLTMDSVAASRLRATSYDTNNEDSSGGSV